MNRGLVLSLVLAVALVAAGAASPTGGTGEEAPDKTEAPLVGTEDYDSTAFQIEVYENGSARWTLELRRSLENESEIDAFQAFMEEFNAGNSTAFENFEQRARILVDNAPEELDREMNATNFDEEASYSGQRGFVRLRFTWTNFADVSDDGTVRVGDVFQDGFVIFEDQVFELYRTGDLRFADAEPEPDVIETSGNLTASTWVSWEGATEFNNGRPHAVLRPAADIGSTNDGAPSDGGSPSGLTSLLVVGFLLVVGLAGGLAWYTGHLSDVAAVLSGGSQADPAEPATEDTAAAAASTAEVAEGELLSDEDRVLNLLEDNGGRMKQVKIVESTDWSKSKVSMLLSDMEEAGEISKLRVGRENIISLAGEEPDAAGSPFEEE